MAGIGSKFLRKKWSMHHSSLGHNLNLKEKKSWWFSPFYLMISSIYFNILQASMLQLNVKQSIDKYLVEFIFTAFYANINWIKYANESYVQCVLFHNSVWINDDNKLS